MSLRKIKITQIPIYRLSSLSQAILAIATTFGLFSASVANAASLNVLWYGHPHFSTGIPELASLAPTFDPEGDGSLDWNLTIWNPQDPTPNFSDYDVLAIGTYGGNTTVPINLDISTNK